MSRKLLGGATLLAIVIGMTTCGRAGTGYELVCKSRLCRYKAEVDIGGAEEWSMVTGYCAGCRKFVYITWDDGQKPPQPVGEPWDPSTGRKRVVYRCKCGKLFLKVGQATELKYFPKCNKETLEHRRTVDYD
ncbi:MAG: hypothetical protein ACE5JM_13895 [Armatimonadota bacterium]